MTAPVGQSSNVNPAQTARTAPAPAPGPTEPQDQVMTSSVAQPDQLVSLTVPVAVPQSFLVQDPQTHKAPIDDYEVKLVNKDMLIVTKEDIAKYTDEVRTEAHPPGKKLVSEDSPAGLKVEMGRKVGMGVANMGGFLAAQSTIWHTSWSAIPAPIGGPLAMVGGAVGVFSAAESVRDALNQKGDLEKQKANNVEAVPIRLANGQVAALPIDAAIKMARDQVVVGTGTGLSSGLLLGTGIAIAAGATAVAAPIAIASIAASVGVQLYAQRAALGMLAQKVWDFITSPFHHHKGEEKPAEDATQQQPTAPPQNAPQAPPQAPPQVHPSQPPQQQLPTPDQAKQIMTQLKPILDQKVAALQAKRADVEKNPALLQTPEMQAELNEVGMMMQQYQTCEAIVKQAQQPAVH